MKRQFEAQKAAADEAGKQAYAPKVKVSMDDPAAVQAEAVRREEARAKKTAVEAAKKAEILSFKEEAVKREAAKAAVRKPRDPLDLVDRAYTGTASFVLKMTSLSLRQCDFVSGCRWGGRCVLENPQRAEAGAIFPKFGLV